jgi:hypothetical protein
MAKKEERPPEREGKASEETEQPDPSDEDLDFWSQWQPTSVADVKRDTYGAARRRSMVKRLR